MIKSDVFWFVFLIFLGSSTFAAQMPINFQEQNFGWRFMSHADYSYGGQTYWVYHPATDLNAINDSLGETPVYAIADGEIVANDEGWGGIVIEHTFNDQSYYSQYGHIYHLENEEELEVGQQVTEGQQIGFVGDIGSDGVHHLHFEIRSPHHPDPDNAGYWGLYGTNINDRKQVFMHYESPLAFIRTHLEEEVTTVFVDSSVTYPGIENDIIDNEVFNDSGISMKENFFKAWNLSEWNTYVPNVGENRGFEGNYHYAPTTEGNESSAGKWYFHLPESGEYEVFVSIPANHATSEHATYEVNHNSNSDYVEINQYEITGSIEERWVSLGTYDFAAGNDHYVKLTNNTGEADRFIGFDTLKLVLNNNGCKDLINMYQTINDSWEPACASTHRPGRYAKYYSFNLTNTQEVTIDLSSSTDTFLFLLNGPYESGNIIESDDDGGIGLNSRIVRTLPAGTYTIEATTYASNRTGSFNLTIQ